ncbi:hypothetical protein BG004_008043 [Podila humilis]|nr:hypothetical protein BG004_008043 [Podila humilis]
MFSTFFGAVSGQPRIPVRIPNDDAEFNAKEYPNVAFHASGKVSGKLRVALASDDNELGLITTRVFVTRESDKDDLSITINRDNETYSVVFKGPDNWTSRDVVYETTIRIPTSVKRMKSLYIEAPNTSLTGVLDNFLWGSIRAALANGSIKLEGASSEIFDLCTSNASISGSYEFGHFGARTSNGSIDAKLFARDAVDGRQSQVALASTNGAFDLHIDGSSTTRGLNIDATTTNGRIALGALITKASQASFISAVSNNGSLQINVDAKHSGQDLKYKNSTMNASVVASVMVPVGHKFEGDVNTANGSATVHLTEDFHGRFSVDTSNSRSTVEGSEIQFVDDKKSSKSGTRGGNGPSEIRVRSSNASTSLSFHATGESKAAPSPMSYGTHDFKGQ